MPRGSAALGFAQYLPSENLLMTTEQMRDMTCMALGGRAAEQVLLGKISTGARFAQSLPLPRRPSPGCPVAPLPSPWRTGCGSPDSESYAPWHGCLQPFVVEDPPCLPDWGPGLPVCGESGGGRGQRDGSRVPGRWQT